jgi:diguanylate cyclase (GGDEF)-like protein/PAS domain S-box-containing protein
MVPKWPRSVRAFAKGDRASHKGFFVPFKKNEWWSILVWPLMGIILIGVLWINTLQEIYKIRRGAQKEIHNEVVVTADSYALQLEHMVEQIDQITLRLKYSWEDPDMPVNLEKERSEGLFPASQLLYASIFDLQGNLVTSTLVTGRGINIFDTPYFQFHRQSNYSGLLISPSSNSRIINRPVIRFTRRLTRPDGAFGGVAVVAVEPAYLITFQENAAPGIDDFAAVRLTTGPVLATKVGNEEEEGIPTFYRHDPIFSSQAGVSLEPSDKFHDEQARFVAWKKLYRYPLVALIGISAHDALAPYDEDIRRIRETAILEGLLLFVFSGGATYFAIKFANRRRQTEETQETYRLATDAANEGFYMIRPIYNQQGYAEDFRLDDCNNRAAELLGTKRELLVGMKASQLKPDAFKNEIFALSRWALDKGIVEEELRVSPRSPLKAKWVYRRVVRSKAGLALTIRDISESKEQEQALASLANNDTLTKLPNRNWLSSFLPNAVNHAPNRTGHMAILFIDLDNFKNINDTLGHDAGDELLVQAAQRLREAVRASDHVARLGGDEFVVILNHVDVIDDVARVANAIIHALTQPFSLASGTGNEINASIGISLYPDDGIDADTLLKHADIAMYAAKAAGKGRYAFYHTHLSDSLILRLSKERALRMAIEKDEFIVHYQPRVGITTGQLTSMEALVRWERPEHGLVYPAEFIDVAEDIGLIVKIGELVIEKVCRQVAQWRADKLTMVPVSVNVSPQQLKSGTLSTFLSGCFVRYGIEPSLIEVELTESAVIDKSAIVTQELTSLRDLGVKLMIDDFGTGYSSMAQLHRLDVDVLKVDQAFTKALSDGTEGTLIFRAIMSMANALDICVVAEGVETVEQLHILQALSCNEIQGYLISKAVAAGEMAQLMLKRFLLSPRISSRLLPA